MRTFKIVLEENELPLNTWEVAVLDEWPGDDEFEKICQEYDQVNMVEELQKAAVGHSYLGMDSELAKELLIAIGKDW